MDVPDFINEMKNKILSSMASEMLVVTWLDNDEVEEWRKAQCESNAGICYDSKNKKCLICKCYIEAKAPMKININPKRMKKEITHCPLGKWADKDIANMYLKEQGKQLLS